MVAGGGGLVLSPAQRSLVEKSVAVRRAREEKAAIQRTLEDAARRHIEDTKARCRTTHHRAKDAAERDHSLIIRHVGEQLASVAKRELLQDPHKFAKKVSAAKATEAAISSMKAHPSSSSGRSREDADGEYDEDRFGPVRRPPRVRPPNLWVSIYDQEQADVKREQEEVQRRRHEAADKYRHELSQQELNKQALRKQEREVADSFAQLQAQQITTWKAQESDKQHKQHEAMVEESKRCQQELQRTLQQQLEAQKKKELSELRAVERYNAMMEEEKRQKELKKLQHKQEMALVKQANALQLELKRKELLREQEEEVKLQKEYEKKLALQEQQRQQELQAILDKQSKKVKLALLNVKSAEEKAREDEERAAIIQKQVRQKEEDELKRRAARKQEVARIQVQALLQQKAERQDKFAKEQVDEDAYAKEFKSDFLQWQQKEQSKQVQVRERNRAYQGLVQQQMSLDEARRASEDKYGMTREEMALNAALLKKAGVAQLPTDAQRTRRF
ncbi:hypothetical protein Gpo141_00010737 [Globisporangium polare]